MTRPPVARGDGRGLARSTRRRAPTTTGMIDSGNGSRARLRGWCGARPSFRARRQAPRAARERTRRGGVARGRSPSRSCWRWPRRAADAHTCFRRAATRHSWVAGII
jgi:hypothetical protein